jgi:predicted RNase H-like nuclease (RuvC/YqgF family)
VADNKINFLEESLDKAKQENVNMKNNNGSKEALRAEVQKCHQIIDSLKKENKELKRNHNEQSFDIKKQTSEQERKVAKIKSEKHHAEKEAKNREEISHELQKKIAFLEKESQELRDSL